MEREFSPITISGIEYESTPIKRNDDDDIMGDEFLTAKDQNTTVSIDGDEVGNSKDISQAHNDSAAVLDTIGLLDPVETGNIKLSTVRNRKLEEHLENKNADLYEKENSTRLSNAPLDPHIPYILSLYFQLVVNIILWSFMIYFIYLAITTIRSDINLKVDEFTIKVLDEIAKCSKEFSRNKCHLPDRPSIMDEECDQLERCQNQDPTKIARLKVTIELIAEIINAFVNRLSYKSLLIMMSMLVIFIIHTSLTFDRFSRS